MAAGDRLFQRLRWRARLLLDRALRVTAERLGFDVIRRSPYSPVPLLPPPGSSEWGPKHSLVGLGMDSGRQLEWLRLHLGPYLAEPLWPADRPAGGGFFLRNGYYGGIDAMLLHALVRHVRPRCIIEVGGGHSTLVLAEACRRNAADGSPCALQSIDPEPRRPLPHELARSVRLDRRSAAEVPLVDFEGLRPGDILFIDSSHTIKRGSEVNFLVLEVLPRLEPGVLVHFHDIFLPYDYPRAWFQRGTYLGEQYLVHAFLLGNPEFEVLLAAHALFRGHGEELRACLPPLPTGMLDPAALWLRKRDRHSP
jgi:hypothetical protein